MGRLCGAGEVSGRGCGYEITKLKKFHWSFVSLLLLYSFSGEKRQL
jgi:hypothetical protein